MLTAAHVIRDAARVRVRFNADRPGEWLADGRVDWSDTSVDAALVTITARPQDKGQAQVGFGRVAERDAVLACSAMGFPRFKLRDDRNMPRGSVALSQYRDSVHVRGTIAVLSNRREGTFEVSVASPERDPDPKRSPWEGMSGAAVWSAGRIIGLVSEHHRADGLGRLAATRVDHWYERLASEQFARLRSLLPGLPATRNELGEVVQAVPSELLQAGYAAQVRDIAPDALVDREEELAELVQFCASEDRYAWWQAAPWAGKSALAAWFVLHPPDGIVAASFFVTGRLAGQADSDAFTEAVIDQLAAITGEPVAATATAAGRDRERRRLVELAGQQVAERHQRLVLVVDGLDEDEGAAAGSGRPSIAALLPKRPPDSVRVLITSRPHPGIPSDVPADHPLRQCRPRRLAPSPFAQEVEIQAQSELLEQLQGNQLQVDIIGFIAAAGGGLTLRELAELTGQPGWLLGSKVGSVFGRSLRTRSLTDSPSQGSADHVYLFAHETLRATAEQELAHDLGAYRQRIDQWADKYRVQDWPENTPRYLLRPYGRALGASGALDRLLLLTTDAARHDRMLAHTYGDAAALAEIATARQLILTRPAPGLAALGRLAVHQDRLVNRNRAVPIELPALWARLGKSHRAEALARSIGGPSDQARALSAVAEALAGTDRERALALAVEAEQTACTIPDTGEQARTLSTVAEALIRAKLWDQAEHTARTIPYTNEQARALSALAEALAGAKLWDQAEQTARTIPRSGERLRALRVVTGARTEAKLREQTTDAIPDMEERVRALSAVPAALAGSDRELTPGLAAEAEQSARTIPYARERVRALSAVAAALADSDRERALALADDAEQTGRAIPIADMQARALSTLAEAMAGAKLWDQAERAACAIPSMRVQAQALSTLAETLAEAKLWDQAEQAARTIPIVDERVRALSTLAKTLTDTDRGRALALAADAEHSVLTIPKTDVLVRVQALRTLAEAMAGAKLWDQAEQAARAIPSSGEKVRALSALAEALAGSDRERALALAAEAEQTARAISYTVERVRALSRLAETLAKAKLWDQAEQAARAIPIADERIRALSALAEALAGGAPERVLALAAEAEQTARTIPDPRVQARTLSTLAETLAKAKLWDQAEQAARAIPSLGERVRALSTLAEKLAKAKLWDQAEQAARAIPNIDQETRALSTLAEKLAKAKLWDQAEQAARAIPIADERARALSTLAETLAVEYLDNSSSLASGSTREQQDRGRELRSHARRLITDLLGGEYWFLAIEPLGKLSSEEMTAIGQEVLFQNFRKG